MDERMLDLIREMEAEGVELPQLLAGLAAIERGATGRQAFLAYEAAAAPAMYEALQLKAQLARQLERNITHGRT